MSFIFKNINKTKMLILILSDKYKVYHELYFLLFLYFFSKFKKNFPFIKAAFKSTKENQKIIIIIDNTNNLKTTRCSKCLLR